MPRCILYAFLAAFFYGVWGFLGKLPGEYQMDGFVLQALMTFGMIPLVIYAAMQPGAFTGRNVRRGLVIGFITGILGASANLSIYIALANYQGPASLVVPVTSFFPALTLPMAVIFLKEKINAIQLVGILVAIAGLVTLNLDPTNADLSLVQQLAKSLAAPWMVMAYIAIVAQALAGITQKLGTDDLAPEGSFVAFFTAFVPIAIIIFFADETAGYGLNWHHGFTAWAICIGVGLSVGLGVLISFAAYRHGKAAVVTPLTGAYPIFTIILALAFLPNERFTWVLAIGTLLVLGGAAAISYETNPQPPLASAVDAGRGLAPVTSSDATDAS